MAISQKRPKRKVSGGRYKDFRKKRASEKGGLPTFTKLGERKIRTSKRRGSVMKDKMLLANVANVFDPKTKKYAKAKIKTITESPANRHYARRNIMTKGTIIDTELGKAKITSRPGQEGTINAVLI